MSDDIGKVAYEAFWDTSERGMKSIPPRWADCPIATQAAWRFAAMAAANHALATTMGPNMLSVTAFGSAATYGLCPYCGSAGKTRERRLNGNDTCERGHTYPSSQSVEVRRPDTPAAAGKESTG